MASGLITETKTYPLGVAVAKGTTKISFYGVFGGATVTLEEMIDSQWFTMLDEFTTISYTAPNSYAYNLHSGNSVRAKVTGATGTTSIYWGFTSN